MEQENPIIHITVDEAKRIIPNVDTIHVHRKSNINVTLFESNYSRTFIRRAIEANQGNLTIAPPDMVERGYGLKITDDVGNLFVRTEYDQLQLLIQDKTKTNSNTAKTNNNANQSNKSTGQPKRK